MCVGGGGGVSRAVVRGGARVRFGWNIAGCEAGGCATSLSDGEMTDVRVSGGGYAWHGGGVGARDGRTQSSGS